MLGARLAHELDLPLAASWHTNVHEYAARRSDWFVRMLPQHGHGATEQTIEDLALATAAKFYSMAKVLYAPNPELCALLERTTGRPCHLMPRGVDAELFHPDKRNRDAGRPRPRAGFCGPNLGGEERRPAAADSEATGGHGPQELPLPHRRPGGDEAWLRERCRGRRFTGVLQGRSALQAYANMDLLVFPSHTDTFGNVVLEASPAVFRLS